MVTLIRLFIRPVKSVHGIGLTHTLADISGLTFDRIFVITRPDSTFIAARQSPQIIWFTPSPAHDDLCLTAPGGSSTYARFADFIIRDTPTKIWGIHFTTQTAPDAINKRLDGFFSREVQLRWAGPRMARHVKRRNAVPLLFTDDYLYLLANEALLRNLQQHCPANVKMGQSRPNLVASGVSAWEESRWKVIRIGDVMFDVVKFYSHYIFTTVSPERGQRHPAGEPLKTLQSFRTAQDNSDVNLGQSLIVHNSDVVRTDDEVEILTAAPTKIYGIVATGDTASITQQPDANVDIDWQGQALRRNNQQVLLEQLENQGVHIPYSCRVGTCGSCRIQLLESEVTPLEKSAMGGNGTILCCGYIPKTVLKLAR